MQHGAPTANPTGLSPIEKAAIEAHLEHLLQDPHFSHSRRFPAFLRFVVHHTLNGRADALKERTLGVEIFGRPAGYDTSADPIVRVTAAEIRKRIAQYYQESGRETGIRLSLSAGSYVPDFHWPAQVGERIEPAAPAIYGAELQDAAHSPASRMRWPLLLLSALMLCSAIGGYLWWRSHQPGGFESFWAPVLNSADPVLLCIADQNEYSALVLRDAADPSKTTTLSDNLSAVVIDDLGPVVKIAGLLQSRGKKYKLTGEGSTKLTDLRNGPTVFVGAFDNEWTLRLTRPLRYHFANSPDMTRFWIEDAWARGRQDWVIDRHQQEATNNYRDYAIVARFTDKDTGKVALIVAGIGRGGTIAGGEFLIDQSDLAQALKGARGISNQQNVEFVLSTEIIDGQPGMPKVEATYFW